MLVWRKISSAKWQDAWEERLLYLGPERIVITRFGQSQSIRLEVFGLSAAEGRRLVERFGGRIFEINSDPQIWKTGSPPKKPISIRGRLAIVRNEDHSRVRPGVSSIIVPAELAFGTGEHATTVTCLRFLCDLVPSNSSWDFLDIGTGTGILAIAAAKLGARRVLGIDFDQTAVAIAKRNVRLNRVSKVEICLGDILCWRAPQRFEIVCANLYADMLIAGMDTIASSVTKNGALIASGILRNQVGSVHEAITIKGGVVQKMVTRGKWVTLCCSSISFPRMSLPGSAGLF